MNGFLNIYKPKGMSSACFLGKVKRILDSKCGHMGTLDPLACGVLPVGVGHASRLFDYLLDKTKVYIATFTFGYATDTLDCEGTVINENGIIPTKRQVLQVLPQLIGEVMQVPPIFSAKCINGKRSYELARQGKTFELPPKKVVINDIKLLNVEENNFVFKIDCGGGTYIRSICRDIANLLNTYATMTSLERVQSGIFTKENAVTFEQLESCTNLQDLLISCDKVVSFDRLVLTKSQAIRLLNGLYDNYNLVDGKYYRVYSESEFWGVGLAVNGTIKMKAYTR